MKRSRHFSRSPLKLPVNHGSEVVRARQHLQQRGWPRLQMALIVALTGAAGFLASYLLRLAGIDAMLLRYPMAVAGLWRVPAARVDLDPLALGNVLEGLSPDVGGGSPSPRMQGMQEQGWWRVCVSHTIWPLLGLLLFFAVLGWLAQECVPGASHLLQVIQGGGVRLAPSYRLDPPRFQLH